MRDADLFQLALGLRPPWYVVSCEFSLDKRRLDIEIDFPRSSVFSCPSCGREGCSAYDTERHTWRHLNFFQHEAYLSVRVPRSRLAPIKEAAYTMKRHWDGILRWFTSKINNGILEGINSLIQAAKARARGYRTVKNLITMIYLIGGKLEFSLPT